MFLLDIFTLIVVFIIGNLLVASLMLVAFYGRLTPVLRRWIACLVLQALGWGLMATCSGKLPVLGFMSISVSYSLMLSALILHFGVSGRYAWPWWPVALTLVFAFTVDAPLYRQIFGNLIAALQVFMAAAIVLWQRNQRTLLRGLMGLSGVFGAAMLVSRAVSLKQGGVGICMAMTSSPELSLMFLSFFVFRFTFMFGFILLIEGKQREEVTRLAMLDSLTGIYNRRTFVEQANRELGRCRRNGRAISLLIFDLDHFKKINDSHGHQVGDQVLCHVKSVVEGCLRSGDIFARYGGEEFVILLPETAPAGAYILAERLRQAIAEQPAPGKVQVTASIGVAGYAQIDEHSTLDKLMGLADQAMYAAKAAGRNLVLDAARLEESAVRLAPAAS